MVPLARNIKRYFSLKEVAIVFAAVVISIAAGVGFFMNSNKDVVIDDNGKQLVMKTMKATVKEVLYQNGISVGPHDYISLPMDTKLKAHSLNDIKIKRAVPISVVADGKTINLMTCKDTVGEALLDGSLKLSSLDRLEGAKLTDKVVKNMKMRIIRVEEKVVSEKFTVPFEVVSRANNHLDKGVEKVTREGKEGIKEKLYKIVYEDDKQISKSFLKDNTIAEPVNKLVEYGTILSFNTSRGDSFRYSKKLRMRATAYTSSYKDTGKKPGDPWFGITCTGQKARVGVIAVDPKVIPLGTKLYVEVPGRKDYGFCVAGDVGSAIKGDLIDLYLNTQDEVDAWGCRKVNVYILLD